MALTFAEKLCWDFLFTARLQCNALPPAVNSFPAPNLGGGTKLLFLEPVEEAYCRNCGIMGHSQIPGPSSHASRLYDELFISPLKIESTTVVLAIGSCPA